MTHWEESPRQTQSQLEGLDISSGLGVAWDPPRGAGRVAGESGRLDKQDEKMDGWMETLKLGSG